MYVIKTRSFFKWNNSTSFACADPQDITFSNHFATKYAKWSEDEANMLHNMYNMYCCAFCGVTDWGGQSANQAGFRMLDIKERVVHGYSRGDISGASSMFDQPLIARAPGQDHQAFTNLDPECGTSDGSDAASISAHVEAVLGVLKHTNPAVKTFKTLAEKGGGRMNSGLPLLPLLPPRAIKDITQHAAARDPTHMGLVNSNLMSDVLSLVAAVDVV
ncbi:hypothetical protein CEUSTIGMA_g1879.t1 [Chlamydomonas eustigma]|uniref:Uncharacterized protein n=1 Tax=Chlamydomonas eustigma TaxID=1157962 RepID=A0A250WV65_9CHLO|nr:hypothetical protein CEUSTIGMA_g1879.t1 [Chlamydomonas eustigma]|eukprot:GAX74430.1 hypothetical protein CEUSTIGMA_g1879.t1 [Chlamydomonas eustigma]